MRSGGAQPSAARVRHAPDRLSGQLRTGAGTESGSRWPGRPQRGIQQPQRQGRMHPAWRSHPADQPAEHGRTRAGRSRVRHQRIQTAHQPGRRVRRGRLGRSGLRSLLGQTGQKRLLLRHHPNW